MNAPLEIRMAKEGRMSKGEVRIASFLQRYSIPYEFERPTVVLDNYKTKLWYPDFTLYDHGNILIEYFGLAGKNRDYDRSMEHKLSVYSSMKLKVIPVFPAHLFSDNYKREIMDGVGYYLYSKAKIFDEIYGRYKKMGRL